MTAREAAFHELEKLVGTQEVGHNRGKTVDLIEETDSLPGVGYAYCQSTQNYAWKRATGRLLADGTASVPYFLIDARRHGWIVTRPLRYDHVLFDWDGNGVPDHVGQIQRVLALGPFVTLRTIEGNTSSGDRGSQSDGGGIYRRTRVVRRSRLTFVRVPDPAGWKPKKEAKVAKKQRLLPYWRRRA